MMSLSQAKAKARKAAFARRNAAHDVAEQDAGIDLLARFLAPYRGCILSGYMPIRSEISPLPVMAQMARYGQVCVPVIQGRGKPLLFREWTPDAVMEEGPFGAKVPRDGAVIEPEVLIVPLVAFDRQGQRLGYGGGFYDRTLERLRARRSTIAVGFAHAAQQADELPLEPTDQPLDAIVTDREIIRFD